jgi:voltage-gated potassium channel
LQGDATSDAVLREAGIERARGLLAATESDASNIYITLSARHLSAALFIIARANHAGTEAKLKMAGADRVLSPYAIGGHQMANLALQSGS